MIAKGVSIRSDLEGTNASWDEVEGTKGSRFKIDAESEPYTIPGKAES